MSSNGERETDKHAIGIMLHGCVDEFFQFGEGDDFVELACDLLLAHTKDGAAQKGIFPAGELRVEAGANFEKATNPAVDFSPARSGPGNA